MSLLPEYVDLFAAGLEGHYNQDYNPEVHHKILIMDVQVKTCQ